MLVCVLQKVVILTAFGDSRDKIVNFATFLFQLWMLCQAVILVIKMTAWRLWENRGKTPNSSVFLSGFIGQVVQSKTSQSTIPGRYGRGSQPFVTKMLQHGWLTIGLEISVRVSKSVCLTVLLRLSTGVAIHQRSPTHGLDWPALEINGSSGHRRWSRLANISNRWCRLSRPRARILWKLLRHTSYRISA